MVLIVRLYWLDRVVVDIIIFWVLGILRVGNIVLGIDILFFFEFIDIVFLFIKDGLDIIVLDILFLSFSFLKVFNFVVIFKS